MKQKVSETQSVLNVWAIVVIIWSAYRSYFRTELPIWFDEFIAKPAIFILPIHFYLTHIKKESFLKALDFRSNKNISDILIGFSIGVVFVVVAVLTFLSKNNFSLSRLVGEYSYSWLLLYLGISIASSISEEVVSRGFVLKRLYGESKNIFSSVFFASLLFFFLHIPILFTNPGLRGNLLFQIMISDFILSFAVSFIFLARKNLIIPIVIHALYNFSLYLMFFN